MDKCPYCGAETRQGDNFCLNCGNRLLSTTPSPSDSQAIGDATVAEPEGWSPDAAPAPSNNHANWASDPSAPSVEPPATREPAVATLEKIAEPGHFVLRSDSGEELQDFPLDKAEIVIGRAPTSDILLSKDKLTSRRHATVLYENGQYFLQDDRSANGTFVNAQQLEEATPYLLQDGDHVGIGEHELVFRAHGNRAPEIEDLPTIAVPSDSAYGRPEENHPQDALAAPAAHIDDYNTRAIEEEQSEESQPVGTAVPAVEPEFVEPPVTPTPDVPASITDYESVPAPASVSSASNDVEPKPASYVEAPAETQDGEVTFGRFASITPPALPDLSALMASLSSLDGQIMSLQKQFNATQEAQRNHDSEVVNTANQLRDGVRRVSDRMDNTIADVARSREALAWAELLQLMEDVMNNPRDIEYVTKLARKARELNKVFQIHQNVLNTMAECNSLLRGLIGEEK
ncbi:FHA domain-containing protein [Dictyobacter arantiisoli]|uniref:FHA domain-containing protein n=1 Tax=Dictyobacter arantiisoli TaxID=2014874 RepID=A0A5A5T9W5_9CHLR|nr:FHA domain-containing protein [Dictyobacter arantiisoli]GCF08127.1 hypothetical protein KDI_16910 [Dictyobacter arantiisoli]